MKNIGSSETKACLPPADKRFVDLSGNRYGRLLVIRFFGKRINNWGKALFSYECLCDCGKHTITEAKAMVGGNIHSCGCLKREMVAAKNKTHGLAHTPEYATWCKMISRCQNPNDAGYKDYGGRNIHVCERWLDFSNFIADMGTKPSPLHSINRINNDLGYSPENCEWATRAVQNRNTRRNKFITYNSITMCVMDWEVKLGLPIGAIRQRLNAGWSVEEAIEKPFQIHLKRKLQPPSPLPLPSS